MRAPWACALLLVVGLGCARTAPAQAVWLALNAHGFDALRRIDPGAQPWAIRQVPRRNWARLGVSPTRTVYVVRVSRTERNALARTLHRDGAHPVGFVGHATRVDALASLSPSLLGFEPTRPDYGINQQATVLPMLADVSAERIGHDIQDLASFHNRFYTSDWGIQSANWLATVWRSITVGRNDIEITKVYRDAGAMPSVVLRIKGTTLPDQVLVLGAHLDSVNWRNRFVPLGQGRAPGADDDASGIADLNEILRVLMHHDFHPARSIHFMAYAGEELGLYGSTFIADDYAARQVDVVGMLQLDMTNYAGSVDDFYLVDDDTDPKQNAFLHDLVHYYLPELTVNYTTCGYACSDHAPWTLRGYAASFPFEARMGEDNPWIHSSLDTWVRSGSQALHARKFARLALAWTLELASDRAGACRTRRVTGAHTGLLPHRDAAAGGHPPHGSDLESLRSQDTATEPRCVPATPMHPLGHRARSDNATMHISVMPTR